MLDRSMAKPILNGPCAVAATVFPAAQEMASLFAKFH
jgi:hypothetical protein